MESVQCVCFKMWGALENALGKPSIPFADSADREGNPHGILSPQGSQRCGAYCVDRLFCPENIVWTLEMYTWINWKRQNMILLPQEHFFFLKWNLLLGDLCSVTSKCWRRCCRGHHIVFHNGFEGDFICIMQDAVQATTLEQSQQ